MVDSPRRALASIGLVGIAIIAGQLATGATFAIMARRVDSAVFGVFAAVYGASLAIGGLIDFGSSQLWTRHLAQSRRSSEFAAWLRRRAAFGIPPTVIAVVVIGAVAQPTLELLPIVALCSQILTYPLAQGLLAGVRALRTPALAAWLVAFGNTLSLLAVIVAPSGAVAQGVASAIAVSWLLTSLLAAAALRGRLPKQERLSHDNPWKDAGPFGLAAISGVATGLHLSVIGVTAGAVPAALAGAVARWVQPIYLLPTAFTTSAFPSLSQASNWGQVRLLVRPYRVLFAAGTVLVVSILVTAGPLVELILGPRFAGSASILRWYALSTIPVLVAQPMISVLQAQGRERPVAVYTVTGGLIGLVAVGCLAPILGGASSPIVLLAYGSILAFALGRTMREELSSAD